MGEPNGTFLGVSSGLEDNVSEGKEFLAIIRQAEVEAASLVEEARAQAEERLRAARNEARRLKERLIAEARQEAKRLGVEASQQSQRTLGAIEAETAEALEQEAANQMSLVAERVVQAFWDAILPVPGPSSKG